MVEVVRVIVKLVERFQGNIQSCHGQAYDEAQLCLINPLLQAPIWGVSNWAGYAGAYKDAMGKALLLP